MPFLTFTGGAPALAADPSASSGPAQPTTAPAFQWSGQDAAGRQVKLPTTQPAVVLFLMADQPQSVQAIDLTRAALGTAGGVQAFAVASGGQADGLAKAIAAGGKWPWPVLIDRDYELAGRLSTHVWPTTVIVAPSGATLGHLAGLPQSYAKELESYLAFATGKIDRAELDRQRAAHQIVLDTPGQTAQRHLEVADRLLAKGLVAQARVELEKGLQFRPNDAALQLALARALVLLGQADKALIVLDGIDLSAASPAKVEVLRGRALMALGKWDQARVLLVKAARLNPEPAEALYALGLVEQHQGEWTKAAEAFRSAFEATSAGRAFAPATQPAGPDQP